MQLLHNSWHRDFLGAISVEYKCIISQNPKYKSYCSDISDFCIHSVNILSNFTVSCMHLGLFSVYFYGSCVCVLYNSTLEPLLLVPTSTLTAIYSGFKI